MAKSIRERYPNFDLMVQYAMAVGVVVLISVLFPNNVKFKYEFKLGDTWRHEDLQAPFDFAIKKSDLELAADRERILQNATAYYRLNSDLPVAKIRDAEAAIRQQVTKENNRLDSAAVKLDAEQFVEESRIVLTQIYDRHVIDILPNEIENTNTEVITMVEGKTTLKRTPSSFYSQASAEKELRNALKNSSLRWPSSLR